MSTALSRSEPDMGIVPCNGTDVSPGIREDARTADPKLRALLAAAATRIRNLQHELAAGRQVIHVMRGEAT